MPSESGSSGPTMVRPGCSDSARRTIAATSFRFTGTQRDPCAMPPLPGAQTTSVTRLLRLTAQASACSRPPEPRMRTFMRAHLLDRHSRCPKPNGRQCGWGKSNEDGGNGLSRCSPILIRGAHDRRREGDPENRTMVETRIKPYYEQQAEEARRAEQ